MARVLGQQCYEEVADAAAPVGFGGRARFDVTGDRAARAELRAKASGRTTVPQIWIGGTHVGGADDLDALDRAGKLDALLAG